MITRSTRHWRSTLLVVALLLATLFFLGQAVTFAWLSTFPEQESRISLLRLRCWSYAALAVFSLVADVLCVVRLLKKQKLDRGALESDSS